MNNKENESLREFKMSCYFIAQITIHNPQKYKLYEEQFDTIFHNYNGKVIAVDDNPTILEGEWRHKRMVVIHFQDEEEAKRWYYSPEYQKVVKYRWEASQADVVLITSKE